MNAELRKNKEILRAFMRDQYTDERLSMLLAHAQAGKLQYVSCCCFVGVSTAQHALVTNDGSLPEWVAHGQLYSSVAGGLAASHAYSRLSSGYSTTDLDADELRRRRIIPMIRAEMKRREMLPESILEAQEVFA